MPGRQVNHIDVRISFTHDLRNPDEVARVFAEQLRDVLVRGVPVRTPAGYGPWGYGVAEVNHVDPAPNR